MADYKMYLNLFWSQTQAITDLEGVVAALQSAQQTTEAMYIDAEPVEIQILDAISEKQRPEEDGPDKPEDDRNSWVFT